MGVRENLQRWREDYAMEKRAEGRTEGQRSFLEKLSGSARRPAGCSHRTA